MTQPTDSPATRRDGSAVRGDGHEVRDSRRQPRRRDRLVVLADAEAPGGRGAVAAETLAAVLAERDREIAELREADRVRAAFLRALAHDLHSPLSVVKGIGSTLAQSAELLEPDVRADLARAVERQADRLIALAGNLLALDRIGVRDPRPELEDTDVAELVRRTVDGLRERTPVVTDLEAVRARVDPVLLERVVENLVRNAIEHQASTTPVRVQLTSEARGPVESFVIRVLDRGPGVSHDDRERIFRPYHDGERRGVGLSIVHTFTRLHDGTVEVEDRPGGGAAFVVRIPLGGPDQPARRAPDAASGR